MITIQSLSRYIIFKNATRKLTLGGLLSDEERQFLKDLGFMLNDGSRMAATTA